MLLAAALFVAAGSAKAQLVEVRLHEEATKQPVAGAVVTLVRDSASVVRALTNVDGRAAMRTSPGTYRIRINRIGFLATLTEPFAIADGETVRRDLALASLRMVLPELVVRGESQCNAQAKEGELAAALWEQIRTALTANVLTQSQWVVPLRVQEFQRTLDRDLAVMKEQPVRTRVVRGPPFGSFAPETLAKRGFVFTSGGDEVTFAAPDAALLVSSEFVDTHCFRAVAAPGDSVGLAFEPVPRRRETDVKGTLWLDRATSELRSISYSYTGLTGPLAHAELGGRLEFERLRTGAWIVKYWYIRMPKVEAPVMGFGARVVAAAATKPMQVVGYIEQGGRVAPVEGSSAAARALVRGRVFDSTTAVGLPGAVIRIRGEADSVVSDADGEFETTSPTGAQTLVVTHAKFGLVPDSSVRTMTLGTAANPFVDFAVPSVLAFAKAFCGATENRAGLIGFVFDKDGSAAEGLDVRVRWNAIGGWHEERTQSGPGGLYMFCELPSDVSLPVRVMHGASALHEHPVMLRASEYRWLDLRP
ncbi:MAG: carboxypeptidase regulatory-like domain-containing protein [Gemmatimonadaceae bacterium]